MNRFRLMRKDILYKTSGLLLFIILKRTDNFIEHGNLSGLFIGREFTHFHKVFHSLVKFLIFLHSVEDRAKICEVRIVHRWLQTLFPKKYRIRSVILALCKQISGINIQFCIKNLFCDFL